MNNLINLIKSWYIISTNECIDSFSKKYKKGLITKKQYLKELSNYCRLFGLETKKFSNENDMFSFENNTNSLTK